MADPLALRRLMARETTISDLLQYLTLRDSRAWDGMIDGVATADRESRIGTRQRADLVLRNSGGDPVAAIEVKLGHVTDVAQVGAYEQTFGDGVPLLFAGLDVDSGTAGVDPSRWTVVLLGDVFARWKRSADAEAAAVATAAVRVLERWDRLTSPRALDGDTMVPLAEIDEPFLARVLTRALREQLLSDGADSAFAGVTSQGGDSILLAFAQIPGESDGRCVVADLRWSTASRKVTLRFGLDYPSGSRSEREAVWTMAGELDDVIRADRFVDYMRKTRPELSRLLTARGSGRPRARGDWNEIVQRGFVRGDAKFFNPGFQRDGDTRLKAAVRVDVARATAADVTELIREVLRYLVSGAGGVPTAVGTTTA